MFIECYDGNFISFVNSYRVCEMHVIDVIEDEDENTTEGFTAYAYVPAPPFGKKRISRIYETKEEAERALRWTVRKINKAG
jgi:hypothetical protein